MLATSLSGRSLFPRELWSSYNGNTGYALTKRNKKAKIWRYNRIETLTVDMCVYVISTEVLTTDIFG